MIEDRAGQVWFPFLSAPSPHAAAASNCGLLVTNCADGRFAVGSSGFGSGGVYQIRPDRTLWKADLKLSRAYTISVSDKWRRVGSRSDWVALWGCGTVIGLTADGTLWVWGADQGSEPIEALESRFGQLLRSIRINYGAGNTSWASPPIITKPQPLMRIIQPVH